MENLETKMITVDDLIECSGCGDGYSEEFLHDTPNGYVCEKCYTDCKKCKDCAEIHIKEDMYFMSFYNGIDARDARAEYYVCKDCLNDNYFMCEKCDEYIHNDCNVNVGDEIWCNNCYDDHGFQCGHCGCSFHIDTRYEIGSTALCTSCWENNTSFCDRCREDFFTEDMINGYCEGCYRGDEDEGENYSNPPYIYYRLDSEAHHPLYFGIELETGTFDYRLSDNWREEIVNDIPSCFFTKSDSSIYDNGDVLKGTEIVSHPMTYKWLKANQDKWNRVLDLRKKGLRSYTTNSCGIHIHLTKSWFSEKHLYKFMKMVYCFPSFTELISQRKKSQLKAWGSIEDVENLRKKAKDKYWYKRYTAINLCNSSTIEIRIFRGTLDRTAFWKDIEYVQALVEFTNKAKVKDLKIRNFVWFISLEQKKFPNLYKWLVKKKKIKR
jgi:hypothetical protein